MIAIAIFFTEKGQYQLAIQVYTKLLEIDSISSDIAPFDRIINLLLTMQKGQASSKLLLMLEKDKYVSKFIRQLTVTCFHGKKWRRDLNIFIDQMLIRSKDENFL